MGRKYIGLLCALLVGAACLVLIWPQSTTQAERPPLVPPKQPAGQTAVADSGISIIWAGDLTPGSRYGLPANGGKAQLSRVAPIVRKADLAIANLEGTLTSRGSDKCSGGGNCYSFRASPVQAGALKWAGFDLFNLANNHAFDFGQTGQTDTIHALQRHGLKHTGRPGQIARIKARGIRVALVGFAPYAWASSLNDIPAAARLVRRASHGSDLVVAIIHAGAEGSDRGHVPKGSEYAFGENRGNSRALAQALIRAGADLVVGSGPHVVRGMEWYKGRLIAYSTGNFAGWNNFSLGENLSESALLQVKLNRQGSLIGGRWISLWIHQPGIPRLDHHNRSGRHAAALGRADFAGRAVGVDHSGRLLIPGPR